MKTSPPALVTMIATAVAGFSLVLLFLELSGFRQLLFDRPDMPQLLNSLELHSGRLFVLIVVFSAATIVLARLAFKGVTQSHQLKAAILQRTGSDATAISTGASGEALALLDQWHQTLNINLSDLERRQRLLIEKAVDVICVLDMEGRFISISKACKEAWGYTPDELKGRNLRFVLEGDRAEQVLASIVGAARSIDRIVFESELRRKDGELVAVVWTGHWSATEGGLFCIVHDISKQKLIEKTVRESEQRLREALEAQQELERMKREFVAMVTHDVRSPLTSVRGLLVLLEQGALGTINDQGREIAGRVHKECSRLLRLLNDMLELDKIEAGAFDLQCAAMDLSVTVLEAVENVRATADVKQVSVEASAPSSICYGDEHRLMQVLGNLLSNAIKYAPENSAVKVTLRVDASMAIVCVEDHGAGIPEEKVAKIFERFGQASPDDARKKGGTGLGLAICKAIVEQHGGRIGVDSKLGGGSKFWFTVPRKLG